MTVCVLPVSRRLASLARLASAQLVKAQEDAAAARAEALCMGRDAVVKLETQLKAARHAALMQASACREAERRADMMEQQLQQLQDVRRRGKGM
jgi:hypothetical protein